MKKVLIVSVFPAPYRVAVFKGLQDEYDIDLFFATDKNESRNKDWFCKTDDFDFYILNTKENRKKFNKAIKNITDYDFVLAYDPLEPPSVKAIIRCKAKKVPYFVNCDGALTTPNAVKDAIKKYILKDAVGYFSSGESVDKYFLRYGAKGDQIFRHCFTTVKKEDVLTEPIDEKKKSELRQNLGLRDITTFISVGQFIVRKGFDILLDAWGELDRTAQLLIIGGGDERQEYLRIIEEKQYKNVFILDFMQKRELFKYYDASDIFVFPTREDIWGLVVNEAMARALPVITTDNCVAGAELIKDGENGFIVPVCNASALHDKMKLLIDNPQLRKTMAENNISNSKNKTIEEIPKRHIEAINRILGE